MRANCKRTLLVLLSLLLLLSCAFPAQASEESVTVLFTHDMHSHLSATATSSGSRGGFGKLKTLIDQERANHENVLLLDAGDFSMGTLYQTVFQTDAAELLMMAHLGFQATTLGNHEFDYGGKGLAEMLNVASGYSQNENLTLPALICSNINWESAASQDALLLKEALETYGAQENMILDIGGVQVGIFGLVGADSAAVAPLAPVGFTHIIESAKVQVAALKAQGAELIICLSHSGLWANPEVSEDELLAKAVPEIDLIISGHTHTTLHSPVVHGNTSIVSCGEYTDFLGKVVLTPHGDRWELNEYALLPTSEDVIADSGIDVLVEQYREQINLNYLSRFGYTLDQVLCQNPGSLSSERDLLADSLIEAVKAAEGEDYVPVDLAIIPIGIIRAKLPEGAVTVSDAYNVLSLGIGPDGVPGYPLVSAYLTGRELYDLAEVDASVSTLMDGTNLVPAGCGWEYKTNRLLLSRVSDFWLYGADGEKIAVEEDKLYRVVADLYSAQLLGSVKDKSFGLLRLEPKDAEGNIITDFEAHIVFDAEGSEVKLWAALADYLHTLGGENGENEISQTYQQESTRIIRSRAEGLSEHFTHAGRIWYVLLGVVIVLLALIALLVIFLRLTIRKIRRNLKKTKK